MRSRISPVPAAVPMAIAATGRTQLRGSRIAASSQLSSSSAASSESPLSVSSMRAARSSGGSTGASAWRTRPSKSPAAWSLMSARPSLAYGDDLLQLTDGPVDQHLGRSVATSHGPRDLAGVHPQREAHDQRLATIVRQLSDPLEDPRQLVAALDQVLRRVRGGQRRGVLDRRLRAAR